MRRSRLCLALAAELVALGALLAGRRAMPLPGALCWLVATAAAVRASNARARPRDGPLVWDEPPRGPVAAGVGFDVTPRITEAWTAAAGREPRVDLRDPGAGRERVVTIEDDLMDGHVILVGAPGTGKTRAMELLLLQAIRRGDAVAVIDPKGDPGLLDRAAAAAGERFRFISPAHPSHSAAYNPLSHFVHPREIADRVAGLLPSTGDAEAFRAFAWEALEACASAMHAAGTPMTLAELRRCAIDGLRELAERCPPGEARAAVEALLRRPREHYAKTVAGLMPLLAKLTSGTNRALLSPERGGLTWPEIDRGALAAYFSLGSMLGADSAVALARLTLADAMSYVGARYAYGVAGRRLWLFVDEAGDVASPEFVSVLNKSRGAGVTIVAAAQSMNDFEATLGSAARRRQVRASVSTVIRFATPDPEEAEGFALSCGCRPLRVKEESRTYEPSFFSAGFREVDDFRAAFTQRTRIVDAPLAPPWAVIELPRMHAFLRAGRKLALIRVPYLKAPPTSFTKSLHE